MIMEERKREHIENERAKQRAKNLSPKNKING